MQYMSKMKSILPSLVEWINMFATLLLIASLVLSFFYQRIALYFYALTTVADFIVNRRYLNNKWYKAKYTFVAMIIFYLCMWIWHLFEPCSSNVFFHSTDIRLPFLAFGIMGILLNLNPKIKIRYLAYTMLTASVSAIIYIIVAKYDVIFVDGANLNYFRYILPQIRHEILHVTHIEFNLYLNTSMILCFINFLETDKKRYKIISVLGVLAIYTAVLFNEGRTGFLTANVLFLLFVSLTILKYRPKLLVPALISIIIVIVSVVSSHQRFDITNIKQDPRGIIWNISTNIIKEKPILGYGVCQGREKFLEHITTDSGLTNFWEHWYLEFPDYNKNRFHCHNAFLESTIEFGIIGLALVLMIFLLPIILTKHKRQLYLSFFILTFGIQAMFESFTFHYQVILFCWLLYFFINVKMDDNRGLSLK